MLYILSIIIGFVLGLFPSAFVVLKLYKGIDITMHGSGNVGAMNSFEVTQSKFIGVIVFLLDALKGLLAVYIPIFFFPINFIYPSLALLFAVLAHCYNPFLNFKGGRGLATAAGGASLLFPLLLVIWVISWILSYLVKRDIILANVAASIISLLTIVIFADTFFFYTYPLADSLSTMILFSSCLMIIILTKHFDPFAEYLINRKLK